MTVDILQISLHMYLHDFNPKYICRHMHMYENPLNYPNITEVFEISISTKLKIIVHLYNRLAGPKRSFACYSNWRGHVIHLHGSCFKCDTKLSTFRKPQAILVYAAHEMLLFLF